MADEIDISPEIELFQQHAALLNAEGDPFDLDPAIVKLAAWVSQEKRWLTKDDLSVLGEIGGMLFRKQLLRRQPCDGVPSSQPLDSV